MVVVNPCSDMFCFLLGEVK